MKLDNEFVLGLIEDYDVAEEEIEEIMKIIRKFPMIREEYVYDIVITAVSTLASDIYIENHTDKNDLDNDKVARNITDITLNAIYTSWCLGTNISFREMEDFKRISLRIIDNANEVINNPIIEEEKTRNKRKNNFFNKYFD